MYYSTTDSLINKASEFLLKYAKAENGFYSQDIKVGRGATPATSNAILALVYSGKIAKNELDNLIEELFTFQYSSRAKYAYSFCTEEVSSNWSTSKAISTIILTSPEKANLSKCVHAIDWLIENKNDDFGWGYRRNDPSRPYYTHFAAEAIIAMWKLTQNDILKEKYENTLEKINNYLINKRSWEGLWSNGQGNDPCPVNTLMALSTLKKLECIKPSNKNILNNQDHSIKFIKKYFMNPQTWTKLTWDEPGIAYKRIEPFPPGKIDTLLNLLDPFDELIIYLIGWIRDNAVTYKSDAIGWLPTQSDSKTPYSWSTARCIISLVYFKERIINGNIIPIKEKGRFVLSKKWKIVDKHLFVISNILTTIFLSILYISIVNLYIGESLRSIIKTPFDYKNIADSVTSIIIFLVPLLLIWIFSITFSRSGEVDFKRLFLKVKGVFGKYRLD